MQIPWRLWNPYAAAVCGVVNLMRLKLYYHSLAARLKLYKSKRPFAWQLARARYRVSPLAVFTMCAALLLLLQPYMPGFSGDTKGWMSSQHFATTMNTKPANYWNGYAYRFVGPEGKSLYTRVHRIPVWPHMAYAALLSHLPYPDSFKVHFSRQVMNLIFILCMLLTFLILRFLDANDKRILALVLIAFSSYYFMRYKDMISPVALGLLGFLFMTYSIARYTLQKKSARLLYFSVFVSISLGEAFPALFVLLSWFCIDTALYLAGQYKALQHKRILFLSRIFYAKLLAGIFRLRHRKSAQCFTLGVLLTIFYVSWNIYSDAKLNQLAWHETGVVDSIARRIPLRLPERLGLIPIEIKHLENTKPLRLPERLGLTPHNTLRTRQNKRKVPPASLIIGKSS